MQAPTLDNAPPDFICPITHEIMQRPILTEHGYNFELNAFMQYYKSKMEFSDPLTCPLTRQLYTAPVRIFYNAPLYRQIYDWCEKNNLLAAWQSMNPYKQNTHTEIIELCQLPMPTLLGVLEGTIPFSPGMRQEVMPSFEDVLPVGVRELDDVVDYWSRSSLTSLRFFYPSLDEVLYQTEPTPNQTDLMP